MTSGPARLVLEAGTSWLDLPAGYGYAIGPEAVKRAVAAAGGIYDPSQAAVVAVPGGNYLLITIDPGAPAETDWQDVLSPAWKDRLFAGLKTVQEAPRADGTAGMQVLSWCGEPTYHAGPPRRMTLPLLVRGDGGALFVKTLGIVSTPERELFVHAGVAPEQQAATAAQVETVLAAIHFGALPDASSPLGGLNWVTGPGHMSLPQPGVSMDLPAGYMYLTRWEDVAAYDKATATPESQYQLAVVAPVDLGWSAVLTNTPGMLGDDGTDPLAGPLKEAWLGRFRQMFETSSGGAGQPTFTVPGYQASPDYTPAPLRSLYLPFAMRGSDGGTWTALVDYLATPDTCLQMMAFVPADHFDAVTPQFQAVARSVHIAYQPHKQKAEPAGAGKAPASPKNDLPNHLPDFLVRGLWLFVAGVAVALWRAAGVVLRATRRIMIAVAGVLRQLPQSEPAAYTGQMPPPLPDHFDA